MRGGWKRAAASAALGGAALLASGCGGPPGTACQEPALLEGFSVVVDARAVPPGGLGTVRLRACQDGTCRGRDIEMVSGTSTMALGCSPALAGNADAGCSASAIPDGTAVGYWATGDFAAGPITVQASAPGFGPFRGTVAGTLVSSGSGACLQRAFQTTLRLGAGGFEKPAG